MIYKQDLNRVWADLVKRGKITTNSKCAGGTIEIGLADISGRPSYYATESSQWGCSKSLEGEVVERFIDGTDFVIQFNRYRGYKPAANKDPLEEGIKEPPKRGVENCLFGCNDPTKHLSLLGRESSGQIVLKNRRYNLYYNAFPIEEEGHFMYVPVKREGTTETIPHIPQKLTRETIEDVLALSFNTEDSILFFNSIHAGASVDHLHIQQVHYRRYLKDGTRTPLRNGKFAIENSSVEKYRGRNILVEYPIKGLVFGTEDAPLIWEDIEKLQERDIPFNWLLIGEKNYLVPRKKEFEKVSEFSNILASLEIAGKLVTSDRQTFLGTSNQNLFNAFGKMSYTIDELAQKGGVGDNPPSASRYDPCSQCAERLMGVGGEPCVGCSYKTN